MHLQHLKLQFTSVRVIKLLKYYQKIIEIHESDFDYQSIIDKSNYLDIGIHSDTSYTTYKYVHLSSYLKKPFMDIF